MRPRHLCPIHGDYGCPYNECYASKPPGPFHCPKCFANNLAPRQPEHNPQPTEQASLFD